MPEKARIALRLAATGRPMSEEHKRRLSVVHRGQKRPPQWRERMGNSQRGNGRGYYFNRDCQKWHARIGVHGKRKHLGFFEHEEEARAAFLAALKENTNVPRL